MSELMVQIKSVSSVTDHPNADRLDIAIIGGWQMVTGKGNLKQGDKVVYFPPDTCLPQKWTDEFNITQYCQDVSKRMATKEPYFRIRQCKLRGEPSFGVAIKVDDNAEIDKDVAAEYDAIKYEPPVVSGDQGKSSNEHPLLQRYTNIENMRNYNNVFEHGDKIVVLEKVHGQNVRTAMIEGELIIGSHRTQKLPVENPNANGFWFPTTLPCVMNLLRYLGNKHKQVILFGESFGPVQILKYGSPNQLRYVAFDLLIDGRFVNWEDFWELCLNFTVPVAPVLFRGNYESISQIKQLSDGQTLLGGDHIREGCVVKCVKEEIHPKIGRKILKYVSDNYLLSKYYDDDTTDI